MPPVFLICGYFSCNSHFKFYSVASSFSKFTLFHYRNAPLCIKNYIEYALQQWLEEGNYNNNFQKEEIENVFTNISQMVNFLNDENVSFNSSQIDSKHQFASVQVSEDSSVSIPYR